MKKIVNFLLALGVSASLQASEAPRYIFYMIGDGMGMGQVMATQDYNRRVLGNDTPLLMMTFPVSSAAFTWSADSPVTDSAAAGTALSCGVKTRNGMLGMSADTVAVPSMSVNLKEKGYGVGIVTSVAPDDATPGAFYAHVPNRGMFYEIGKQFVASDVDFLAGAWLRGLRDGKGNETDLRRSITEAGIELAIGPEQIGKTTAKRVIVLNNDSISQNSVGYAVDGATGGLTLTDLTIAGIDHLKRVAPERFFIMVESGNIDHAGHANDGAAVVKETLAFQEAIQLAYDFYLQHPDETLIVITADHETGGMSLGNASTGYTAYTHLLDHQKISKDNFADYWKAEVQADRVPDWETMQNFLKEKTGLWNGIEPTEREARELRRAFDDSFTNPDGKDIKTMYHSYNSFVTKVFKTIDAHTGMGWTSGAHTGNPVPVYAIGVGADKFAKISNNTEIPARILEIANR